MKLSAKARAAIKSKIPAHEVKPILDNNFEQSFLEQRYMANVWLAAPARIYVPLAIVLISAMK